MRPQIDSQSNRSRISRILDSLQLLRKSLNANKATQEEVLQITEPVIAALEEMGALEAEEQQSAPQHRQAPLTQRLDIELADAAREAPLKDLTRTLFVIMNRVDELIDDHHKESKQ